jgi:hypothetical protein
MYFSTGQSTLLEAAMSKRLSARFIELTYHAALKSYWRKQSLKAFLRRCGVSEPLLTEISATRIYLSKTGSTICSKAREFGIGARDSATNRTVVNRPKHFPGFRKLGGSAIKIANAKRAVSDLAII